MRVVFVLLAVLLLVPSWSGRPRLALLGKETGLQVTRVALYPGQAERHDLGELEYLGGIALHNPQRAFGSFSAMTLRNGRFTLLSDGGNIVRFTLGRDWTPTDVSFGNLRDGPGTGWEKRDRDSESMSIDPRTGEVLIGFERANQLWRYDAGLARTLRHAQPEPMRRWSDNGGPESLVALPDGGAIVLSERRHMRGQPRGVLEGLRFAGDPTRNPDRLFTFGYRPPKGYLPTDAAVLRDGRLLVLNRSFRFPFSFTAALTVVELADIAPGRIVQGRVLARFQRPALHDNFEALAVTYEKNATHLWIASDDNQSWLQRSLLLKFRLRPRK